MLWKKCAALALLSAVVLCASVPRAYAQTGKIDPSKAVTKEPLPALPTTEPAQLQGAVPVGPQEPPNVLAGPSANQKFEFGDSVISLPSVLLGQWSPTTEVPPESIISQRYVRTADTTPRKLTLKETIYIALRNNPSMQAIGLDPLASNESVKIAYGTFDPTLTSQLDVQKSVTPTTSVLQTGGASAFVTKVYDWNFGANKVMALTNGTLGVTFNNTRVQTNSGFSSVNPSYTPNLTLSLSQPLLQDFGWRFATLNVRIAESGQKQAQWNYAQSLMDFVRQVGALYWAVVRAEQDLEVQRASLRFNQDLVRQNSIAVKVGTLAPIDLQEAQSAQATSEANVFTAEAFLQNSRAALRQVVMFNPEQTFLPAEIQPAERPNPSVVPLVNEEKALETAVQFRPSLAGMREA
ncbi:MAG: TolC family protein, partial [Burkholderiales bacterium]